MPTVKQMMKSLKSKGSEQTRKVYLSHGAKPDSVYGVKVSDLKILAKTIKGEQELAYELFETGNFDAMYLAGMIADGSQMTKKLLETWAKKGVWEWVSEYIVPWVAAESDHGRGLALKWMDAKKEHVAASGWNTYSGLLTTLPDEQLDLPEIKRLLKRIEKEIDGSANRVRYTMNAFVIAVGSYVLPLSKQAKATAKKLGKVEVDMGGTACKVPLAVDYIAKMETSGRAGKKRKAIRC